MNQQFAIPHFRKRGWHTLLPALTIGLLMAQVAIAQTDVWTQKADFGGGIRFLATGFSIGTKGYMGLGYDASSTRTAGFWEYDPTANAWTQKADFGGGVRNGAVGFSIGTKGYVGTGGGNADFWEYDPTANAWTQKANYGGGGRDGAVGFSIGTKGYVGTGQGAGLNADFWAYDPTADTWTQKANYGGGGRSNAVGFAIGTKGYIGTGGSTSGRTADFWEYDPTANAWTQKANYGGGGRDVAVGFGIGTQGYIGCGTDASFNSTAVFWAYDPTANTWAQKADFGGGGRNFAVGFSIGTKGYAGTGQGAGLFADFWEYAPSVVLGGTPTPTITAGTATGTITACQGTASVSPAVQTFTVSGSALTGDIVTLAPTNFQLSTNASTGFAASLTLTQSGGTVSSTPLYVRSAATAPATSLAGSVTLTSAGATTQTVAVSGTVSAIPNVSITATPSLTITSGGNVTLTASGATSYTWSNGSTANPLILSNVTSATTLSVTGTTGGCSATASAAVSVTANCTPFVPQNIIVSSFIDPALNGVYTPNGSINGAPSWTRSYHGVATLLIKWDNFAEMWMITFGGSPVAQNTSGSITNLPCTGWEGTEGRTNDIPTLSGGCGSLAGGGLSVSIAATPSLTIASGGSVTLTASGASSYIWSNGASTTAITVSNVTSATTLSVTGTTGACSATASAAVSVTACSLTATISGNLNRCPDGATSLTASGAGVGGSYRWLSGETTSVISATTSGNYSVTITSADGCTATTIVSVDTWVRPAVSIIPTPSLTVCAGQSITLTANAQAGGGGSRIATVINPKTGQPMQSVSSALSYTWSTGSNLSSINFVPTATTVISVTAHDGTCPSLPVSVTVTLQPAVTATITANPGLTICANAGGMLTASGAGNGGSYRWSTNATTAAIPVNSSNPYTVTATSSGGCYGTATVTVTALNPFPLAVPTLSASTSAVCEGGSVSVTATVTGSVETHQWYRNGASLGSAQSTSVLTLNGVVSGGSYVLVIGTSGCGSATSTAFTLSVNPLPTVTIVFPQSAMVNPGPVVTVPVGTGLQYQVFGGGNNARYERKIILDRINGFEIRTVMDNATGIFPIDKPGPYTITVTDGNGCSRTVTGQIR